MAARVLVRHRTGYCRTICAEMAAGGRKEELLASHREDGEPDDGAAVGAGASEGCLKADTSLVPRLGRDNPVSPRPRVTYIPGMKAYLFDLDGTLADSRAGLYPAFRVGLQAIGMASVGDLQLAAFLGTPLPEMFRAFRPSITQREIDAGIAAFRVAYELTGIVASELYPGVIEMLAAIRQRGAAISVVTSKPEPHAVRVVTHLKLDRYVAGVVGAGLAETDTKTELVARALQVAGVASHEA